MIFSLSVILYKNNGRFRQLCFLARTLSYGCLYHDMLQVKLTQGLLPTPGSISLTYSTALSNKSKSRIAAVKCL